jgi:hypothetical protein
MSHLHEDYMRCIEERLPELRKQLKSMVSGERMNGCPSKATEWMDTTGREIALLKRAITDFEDFLERYLASASGATSRP